MHHNRLEGWCARYDYFAPSIGCDALFPSFCEKFYHPDIGHGVLPQLVEPRKTHQIGLLAGHKPEVFLFILHPFSVSPSAPLTEIRLIL